MHKQAARYASQPAFPLPPAGGMGQFNRYSALFPYSPGLNFQQAAQAAQAHPNPLANIPKPQVQRADVAGVQAAQQKMAQYRRWQAVASRLSHLSKQANMPPGAPPPLGMPPGPPPPGMPPGAPPPGMPPGPPMPPGPMPPVDPKTGQPLVPPDPNAPPAQALPVPPRKNPPRPRSSEEAEQEARWLALLEAKQKAQTPADKAQAEEAVAQELLAKGGADSDAAFALAFYQRAKQAGYSDQAIAQHAGRLAQLFPQAKRQLRWLEKQANPFSRAGQFFKTLWNNPKGLWTTPLEQQAFRDVSRSFRNDYAQGVQQLSSFRDSPQAIQTAMRLRNEMLRNPNASLEETLARITSDVNKGGKPLSAQQQQQLLEFWKGTEGGPAGWLQRTQDFARQLQNQRTGQQIAASQKAFENPTIGQHLMGTAQGAFMGGISGHEDSADFHLGPFGFSLRNALMGAAAWNPYLASKRKAINPDGSLRFTGVASVPAAAFRHGVGGSFAGSVLDMGAGALGYDTDGYFNRMGGYAGMLAGGLGRGTQVLGQYLTGNPLAQSALTQGAINFNQGATRFMEGGMMEPFMAAFSYLPRGVLNKAFGRKWGDATPGLEQLGFGKNVLRQTPDGKMTNLYGLGRLIGYPAFFLPLGYGAYEMAKGQVYKDMDQYMQEAMQRMPQQMLSGVGNYLRSLPSQVQQSLMGGGYQQPPMVQRGGAHWQTAS